MIDTSTTAGKIKLMNFFDNGKRVQRKPHDESEWLDVIKPNWNWGTCDFRLKPKTVEEAAVDYTESKLGINYTRTNIELGFMAGAEWKEAQTND